MGCGCNGNRSRLRRSVTNPRTAQPRTAVNRQARTMKANLLKSNIAAKAMMSGGVSAATNRQRKRIEKIRREAIKSKFGK